MRSPLWVYEFQGADCNGNGTLDVDEIVGNPSLDCNADGVPDECEIDVNSTAPGGPFFCTVGCDPDCNDNGIPDECDVPPIGLGPDCNTSGIPDECEPDFDGDGLIDDCDDDDDNDGVLDVDDVCPFTAMGLTVRADGRPKGDMNDDCLVNALDIQLFIQQMLNQ